MIVYLFAFTEAAHQSKMDGGTPVLLSDVNMDARQKQPEN